MAAPRIGKAHGGRLRERVEDLLRDAPEQLVARRQDELIELVRQLHEHLTEMDGRCLRAEGEARGYRELLAAAPLPLLLVEPQGRIAEANVAAGERFGLTPRELIGLNIHTLIAPAEIERLREALERTCHTGESTRLDVAVESPRAAVCRLTLSRLATEAEDHGGWRVSVALTDPTGAHHAAQGTHSHASLYEELLRNFPNGAVAVFDRQLRFQIADGQALGPAGLDPARLIGLPMREALPAELVEQVIPAYEGVLRGEEHVFDMSYAGREFEVRARPLRAADGAVSGGICVAQDVTRRRAYERELRSSEDRLRKIMESTADGVWDHNVRDVETRYSASLVKLLDVPAERLGPFPRMLVSWGHPEDREGSRAAWEAHLTGAAAAFRAEFRLMTGGGRWVWVLARGRCVEFGPGGEPLRVLGTIDDVTERRRAEQELRRSHGLLRAIFDQSTDAMFVKDVDGYYTLVNKSAGEMAGVRAEDLIGRRDAELFGPPVAERIAHLEGTVLRTRTAMHREETAPNGGDAATWLTTRLALVNEAGQTIGLLGLGRNITERKRMEEKIRQYNQNLEELVRRRTEEVRRLELQRAELEKLAATGRIAAGVAHEINNPLGGIKNSFLIVKGAIPEGHPDYRFVELIEREIDRIGGIVRQMYQLYQPELAEARPVDLGRLIEEVCLITQGQADRRGVRLERTASEVPRVLAPEGNLRQILLNLLMNAVEASAEGQTIRIDAVAEGGGLRLSVRDEGTGIAHEDLERVFEPFFTTKHHRDGGGMGLGLAVSQSLARAMGGELSVASRPGEGASFTLTLPPRLRENGEDRGRDDAV